MLLLACPDGQGVAIGHLDHLAGQGVGAGLEARQQQRERYNVLLGVS